VELQAVPMDQPRKNKRTGGKPETMSRRRRAPATSHMQHPQPEQVTRIWSTSRPKYTQQSQFYISCTTSQGYNHNIAVVCPILYKVRILIP